MRLIDADAYAIEMRKRQDACRKWKSEQNVGSETYARAEQALVTFVEAWVTLEKQPTIDAIPVEWMRKKREVAIWQFAGAIDWLLSEWKKEQEARNESGV